MTNVGFVQDEFHHAELMTEVVARACDVDTHVAERAVRQALNYAGHFEELRFMKVGSHVKWKGFRDGPRRTYDVAASAGGHAVTHTDVAHKPEHGDVYRQPACERAVILLAVLIPLPERMRLIDEWLDHLQCVRAGERSNWAPIVSTWAVAMSIVSKGLVPIAIGARITQVRRVLTSAPS